MLSEFTNRQTVRQTYRRIDSPSSESYALHNPRNVRQKNNVAIARQKNKMAGPGEMK